MINAIVMVAELIGFAVMGFVFLRLVAIAGDLFRTRKIIKYFFHSPVAPS